MLGRKSRIYQSPMVPIRAIPSSVEFNNGERHEQVSRREHRLQSRRSQPIPIKKCRLSPQELEDEATSADSASHYDWATWRMYDRITTARRLRAVSRSVCVPVQHHPAIMTQEYQTEEAAISHIHCSRPPTMDEEDANDGVFDFDSV